MTRREFGRGSLILAAAASMPGLAKAKDTALTIGVAAPFTTLDPHEQSNSPNNATSRHIFDSLINRGGKAENNPQLATNWNNTDDTHWEFVLRKNVKFHDGSDFTAKDVVASLLRARDKPSQSFASYTRNIKQVTAKDPHTVVVETTVPDPMILNSLSRIRIISAKYAKADVSEFDSGKAAVGTGPFKYKSYMPGDRLVVTRNEDYFAGPAHWSLVTLRILPDNGARLANLLSGDADLIENLPAQGIDRVKGSSKFDIIRGQSTRLVFLGMDIERDKTPDITAKDGSPLDKNPLKDERVRRAMLMSINRKAIVDRVMEGNGTVAHQFVAEGYAGHSDDVEPVKYDPEQAKKLLDEAGWKDGFRLTLHGPSGRYVDDSQVLQAVGQFLARIGIETKVNVMPWAVYSEKYNDKLYGVYLASWGINTGEVSNPALALVAKRDSKAGTGRYNAGGVDDPRLNALIKEATRTLDEKKRTPLLEEVSEITFNNLYLLPMHYENVVMGAKKTIKYEPRGDKYTLAYEVKPA
ncbi:ABC transporter substrate-binding protein [Pararhizobium mangrovi]|uniref:ABC transporter substrate-binding protein n=1 Tax=Pararhizobium mangrovi TaxID=2590452 RepID=UPI0038B351C6